MNSISKVLLVEDDDIDARKIMQTIRNGLGDRVVVDWVTDRQSAIIEISKNAHDVCLVDYKLGPDDGIELIQSVSLGCRMPIILLTGMSTGIVDITAIKAGASDYLVKEMLSPAILNKSISYAMARQQIHNSLIEAKESIDLKKTEFLELYNTTNEIVESACRDLRSSSTAIDGFASILIDGSLGDMNGEQRKYLNFVQERNNESIAICNDMQDAIRIETGSFRVARQKITVGEVINRIERTFEGKSKGNDVRISIDVENEDAVILCDPENISRVFASLGFDAIKLANRGDDVSIRTKINAEKSHIIFYISDNQNGLTKSERAVIFDHLENVTAGSKTNTKGFGLGLSIANELVRMNFGELSIERHPEAGITYAFGLPLFKAEAIISEYADSVLRVTGHSNSVALLDLKIDSSTSYTDAEIEHLLQPQMNSGDLLLQNGRYSWILCARLNPLDLSSYINSYNSAFETSDGVANREDLPTLSIHDRGIWNLKTQRNEFVVEFLANSIGIN